MKAVLQITSGVILIAVALLALEAVGLFGIHDIRIVNNNPFSNPATVLRIDPYQIAFADGRILKLDFPLDSEYRALIEASNNTVGLDPTPESQLVMLCVRREQTICQLGRPIFVLPLILHDRPKYAKKTIAWGKLVMPTQGP